jgi:ssDNA-binding Zn-finger/Zn-ribbon topoisomerase 1
MAKKQEKTKRKHFKLCNKCGGTGDDYLGKGKFVKCENCNGTGKIEK